MRQRLLVVDDSAGYRRLVRLALDGDPSFEVVAEAGSAEEAVSVAARHHPDVSLVDVLLPGQGFRLPGLLRTVAPACVVVFTSAHPDGDIDAVRQLGGISFLPKSVAPGHLARELGALLDALSQVQGALEDASIQLPASHESPRTARRFVEGVLAGWERSEMADTVTLLVSELVGNAVLHARSDVELRLRLMPDRLRVDVIDRSTLVPRRRQAANEDQTGRGSSMVEALTTAWGITGRPDGKSVWFEIALARVTAVQEGRP